MTGRTLLVGRTSSPSRSPSRRTGGPSYAAHLLLPSGSQALLGNPFPRSSASQEPEQASRRRGLLPAFSTRATSIPLPPPYLRRPNLFSANTLRHPILSPVPSFPRLYSAPRHLPSSGRHPTPTRNSFPPNHFRQHHSGDPYLTPSKFPSPQLVSPQHVIPLLPTFSKFRLLRSNNPASSKNHPLAGRRSQDGLPVRRDGPEVHPTQRTSI